MRRINVLGLLISCVVLLLVPGNALAIYGGQDADISEFPWMVSIQVPGGSAWQHNCGGTLVSSSWVLTAAHCVADVGTGVVRPAHDLKVVVGQDKQNGTWTDSARRAVSTVVFYPADDGTPLVAQAPLWRGDVALLKLADPIYNVPTVQLGYGEMPVGTTLTATGWGNTADFWLDKETPDQLQKLDFVRVQPDRSCWDDDAVAATQICTKADRGVVTRGGPRKGDSGGPLLLRNGGRWIQLGVLSHLPRACATVRDENCGFFAFLGVTSTSDGDPNFSGWASVKRYRDWITSTISQTASASDVSTALIIDSSGSMSSNDPGNRRLAGANSYVTASLPDDQVGVVDFDDSARVVSPAVRVGDNRQTLAQAINGIDASGGTDLGAGLTAGCGLLSGAGGARRAAIFLTDGQGSYADQSSCFANQGWPVFTIGLGSGVDRSLLERIATETGGSYLQLDSSTNLVCEFQQIRSQIAGLGRTGCTPTGTINLGQSISFPVSVATLLKQFTFTNTWLGSDVQMTVTSPSGRSIDRSSTGRDVTTSAGATYETFTVTDPEPGEWSVKLYGAVIPAGGEPYTFSTVGLPKQGADLDSDGDQIADPSDNCAYVANADQRDADGDGDGDLCDADFNPDADGDGVDDDQDNCSSVANVSQADLDADGKGDVCDPDDDNDAVADGQDNCGSVANADQADLDTDGKGDACDPDDDNDNVADTTDRCARTVLPEPRPARWSKNGYVANASGVFVDPSGRDSGITVADTRGCSGRQIVYAAHLGRDELIHGISRDALGRWVRGWYGCTHASRDWAPLIGHSSRGRRRAELRVSHNPRHDPPCHGASNRPRRR